MLERCAVVAMVWAAALVPSAAARAQEPVTVFAAASLTDAMEEIGRLYGEQTGHAVRFSFASSSTLARQIEAGAPARLFASASEQWMDYLAERGLIEKASRTSPIGNSLVLIAPADSPLAPQRIDGALDLAALLGPDERLAVGDPDHVPAGIYARKALEALGLWEEAEPRLARADNVRAALALVEQGETPLGIVYGTDAAATDRVRIVGTFPVGSHPPVSYPFALVAGAATEESEALLGYMTGEQGLAVFRRFGFTAD
ncbi:molybdate ABC transporter substrate-binding protein [Marinimicrococcus flavescens]|uniref:Molybdate ABC transporter substrate-binding protein n=1 Tax=Marinimicrococcus flavescens TaxID=3031815 RepID=A0AAP3XS93_9PROT|nr:molybdate ABC transporter substrate-binding protein [Marinimicrococcus flavescens]